MASPSFLRFLLLAAAAAAVSAWPQHTEDSPQAVLPFHHARSLPSIQEVEGAGTLHLPQVQPRAPGLPVVDEDETGFTLPVAGRKRHLPQVDLPAGVLTLPVIHAAAPSLVGRSVDVQLENRSDVAYYAQLDIGSPPQSVYAQLDTGSWELWVNPSCDRLTSSADRTFCAAVGQYDPDDSSTSSSTGETRTLNYGIGSADIAYYTDDIRLSDADTLTSVQFGVASRTEDQFAGVLGIGYGKGVNTKYANLVDELAAQGITERRAFSVALGSKAEGGGVISFGGVDRRKFRGRLASLPVIPADDAPDGVARYWVSLESISLAGPASGSGSSKTWDDTAMPVFLDTGATLTLLPPDVVKAMARDLGSDGQDDAGFYSVDCGLADNAGTIDFAFDGVTVKVPYREMIRQFGGGSGSPTCYLGVAPSDDYALLGDTFLRSAYVVFDLDADTVYLAQYDNCGSDVSSIKSSSDLDGLQGACGDADDDDVEEEDVGEEEDEEEEETSATSTEKITTATITATATSTNSDNLPVVVETVTSAETASTLSTVSRPTSTSTSTSTPTGSSEQGLDSATEADDSDAGASDQAAGNNDEEGNADGAAGRLVPSLSLKNMLAVCAGTLAVML